MTEDAEAGTPLERFLAEAALLSSADTVVGNEDGVTLMTLHTAKGLEWPVVVLTGHGARALPAGPRRGAARTASRRSGGSATSGLTRAKDKLYLTWARARRRGGELRPGNRRPASSRRSRPSIVEERRTTSLWAPDWGGGRRGGGTADRAVGGGGATLGRDGPPPDRPAVRAVRRRGEPRRTRRAT